MMDLDFFMGLKDSYKEYPLELMEFANNCKPIQSPQKHQNKNYKNNKNNYNNNKNNNYKNNYGSDKNNRNNRNNRDSLDDFNIERGKYKSFKQDDMKSKIRGALNKLSKNNIDSIITELNELSITKDEDNESLIDIIFSKAYTETKFSNLYAIICKSIKNEQLEKIMDEKYKVLYDECINLNSTNTNTFKNKNEATAFMSFVGDCYNEDVMDQDSIICIIDDLLDEIELDEIDLDEIELDKGESEKDNPFRIDYICSLMTTACNKLNKECKDDIEEYLITINKLKDSNYVDLREKFALIELIDLYEQSNKSDIA